jgi:hypothetical protein
VSLATLAVTTLTTVGATLAAQPAPALSAAAAPAPSGWFERVATYPVFENVPAGVDPADETVAEISAVTDDGNTMIYTDALGQRIGFLDITDPAEPVGAGTIDVTELGDADDQPTSVSVLGQYVLVAVDTSAGDFVAPSGRLDVIRISDRTLVRSLDLGGQPDSIAVSPDLEHVAIVIENQRDEDGLADGGVGEEGDLPQAPAGFVQVLDIPDPAAPAGWLQTPVPLPAGALSGMDTPEDAEPEYVDINDDGLAAVTLQENNGVVVIDLDTLQVENGWSAGSVTLDGIDDDNDEVFDFSAGLTAPREPDAIQWVGDNLVATANEGDWKGGTRGWTVFEADTGDVVWDAGTSFEYLAVAHGLFNNDRADNKGAEPEGMAFDTIGGTPFVFVGSERSNFVAAYDMTDPEHPALHQVLPTTNGPEGLLPVPSRGLLLTSSETDESDVNVRATIGVFRFGDTAPAFPSITSTPTNGTSLPIPWTALGALSAAPGDGSHLWTASDAAVDSGRLYSVDVSGSPAVVDDVVEVTEPDGTPAPVDIEGVAARVGGGFWLGSEGTNGPGNALVRLSASGVVQQRVSLPPSVAAHVRNWGIEGVAVRGVGAEEQVLVALQRPLWVDPSVGAGSVVPLEGNVVRIGRYDVLGGTWAWFTYPLSTTSTPGDWIGLSEITVVDDDTVAVIERDKLNGPRAAIKRVYTVDLPDTAPGTVTPVTKTLAVDVLPLLRDLKGWTQEKLEGLTIGADNRVYAVTDNDGLVDATGETQFLCLGAMTEVFAGSLTSSTSLALGATSVPAGESTTATVAVSPAASGGTVVLMDGNRVLGSETPTGGTASFPVTLDVGTHQLTATWSGTERRRGSTSAPVTLTVDKRATATSLAAPRKVKAGVKAKLVARVDGGTGGTVTFKVNGKKLRTVTLRSSVARIKVRLPLGTNKVAALYSGSESSDASRSRKVTVRVVDPRG